MSMMKATQRDQPAATQTIASQAISGDAATPIGCATGAAVRSTSLVEHLVRLIDAELPFRLRARALTVHVGPGIGVVDRNMLDRHPWYDFDAALRIGAVLEFEEDFILDLRVPRKIEIAGLNYGARRRHRVPTALQLDRVKIRPIGHMVGGIPVAFDQVAGLEIDEPVRAGPHWLEVCRCLARVSPLVGLEQVLGDNQAVRATCPERRRFLEANTHGK